MCAVHACTCEVCISLFRYSVQLHVLLLQLTSQYGHLSSSMLLFHYCRSPSSRLILSHPLHQHHYKNTMKVWVCINPTKYSNRTFNCLNHCRYTVLDIVCGMTHCKIYNIQSSSPLLCFMHPCSLKQSNCHAHSRFRRVISTGAIYTRKHLVQYACFCKDFQTICLQLYHWHKLAHILKV